jgi:hypothetical protein
MKRIKQSFLALALIGTPWLPAGETSDSMRAYEKDLRLLGVKVTQYRYRLKSSAEGAERLAALEEQLARLKAAVDQLNELAGAVDAQDGRVHYLKEMEVGPKGRDFERFTQASEQRYEQLDRQRQAVDREWDWWATQKHHFNTPEEQAGLDAAWVQYNRIKALDDRYKSDYAQAQRELREQYEQTLAAYTKAQEELGAAATKREQLAERLQGQMSAYNDARGPLVAQIVQLDNTPEPVSVPLTPFPNGVPPADAGLIPRGRPPVGPGSNTRALDQLRVVTASSRSAAGRDDQDLNVTDPVLVTASTESTYGFDTGGGTGVAPLPDVAAAPATAAVPLVLPVSPVVAADAPAPVRNSPKLQQLATRQEGNVKKLDDLYAARRALLQRGPEATPAEWTKVVQDISTTHAAIIGDVVAEKMAAGSKTIDLTFTPPPQRKKISDIVVPSPGSPLPPSSP